LRQCESTLMTYLISRSGNSKDEVRREVTAWDFFLFFLKTVFSQKFFFLYHSETPSMITATLLCFSCLIMNHQHKCERIHHVYNINSREKINNLKFLFDLFLQYIAHTCYYYMITLLRVLPPLHANKDGKRRILKSFFITNALRTLFKVYQLRNYSLKILTLQFLMYWIHNFS